MAAKAKSSEVHAYAFINDDLKERGWNVRNPSNHAAGQVWTQNECLAHPEIKKYLGLDKPENVVKTTESDLWIIEAKPYHDQIKQAVDEAVEYAEKLNKGKTFKARFISGVAGNPDVGYFIETRFLVGKEFVPITMNKRDISSLISPEIARTVLKDGPDIQDVVIDEALFLSKAEKINEYLHLGAINKNQRARVIAALLLSLIEDTPPNIDAKPSILIDEINSRVKQVLSQHKKTDFYKFIEIETPASRDNHVKFKKALVQTIQELNNLNIRSAMNSGVDVLGKFYEVFLKYGNGAKEIGIVLTPRHITAFAADVLSISDLDVVYDPTCGTGGFLVAAFDHVKKNYNKVDVDKFKEKNLFGVEQEDEVVALAIVNMIFRGDGKNNITEGNCLLKQIVKSGDGGKYVSQMNEDDERIVTKVLMNPPFALKDSTEKEFRFVNHALEQMRGGGGGYSSQFCRTRSW